jgi:hypothetical protein
MKERIRHILREETNPKQRMVIKTINDAGFITATKIFGGIKRILDIIGDDSLTKRLKIKIISDLVYNHDDNNILILYDMYETPIVLTDTDETLSQIEGLFSHYVSVYYYGGREREQVTAGRYMGYDELSDEVISEIYDMVINYYIKYYHQTI